MTKTPDDEQNIVEDEEGRPRFISRRRRVITNAAMILGPVVIVGLLALGLLGLVNSAATAAKTFGEHVLGEERTDAEMIQHFREHESQFEEMVEEYGLPGFSASKGGRPLAEGYDLGGVGAVSVVWNDYRYVKGVEGDAATSTLWLATWEVNRIFSRRSKGYVFSRDALSPLVGDLSQPASWGSEDAGGWIGARFVPLGDGWYLFYAYWGR